ncbi:MAG: YraN family protein [Pseudomonadota bacterium]
MTPQSFSSGKTRRDGVDATAGRRRRYRAGWLAEFSAAAWLMMKGYRVIDRRVKTPAGEIDLIVVRRGRVSFVEVKARRSQGLAEASVTDHQRRRIKRAADLWLQRHARFQTYEVTFDVVFMISRRLPQHIVDGL